MEETEETKKGDRPKRGCARSSCPVCLEEWEVGEIVTEMPCKHCFHGECLKSWLSVKNTCPVCRFEIEAAEVEGGKEGETNSNSNNDDAANDNDRPDEGGNSTSEGDDSDDDNGNRPDSPTTANRISEFNNTIDDLSNRREELYRAFRMDVSNSNDAGRVMHVISPGTAGDNLLLAPGSGGAIVVGGLAPDGDEPPPIR